MKNRTCALRNTMKAATTKDSVVTTSDELLLVTNDDVCKGYTRRSDAWRTYRILVRELCHNDIQNVGRQA